MKATSISKVAVFLLVLTSALAPNRLAFSQVTAGAISGVVTDPSGGTVPGAVVEATNLGTNRKSSSNTTQVGKAEGIQGVRCSKDYCLYRDDHEPGYFVTTGGGYSAGDSGSRGGTANPDLGC